MMMILHLKKIMILFCSAILLSCSGRTEKSWVITDFSKSYQFKVEVPPSKNVVNANIYLEGDFLGTIYLSKIINDSTLHYTQKDLPVKIMSDFYGGTFKYYLAPSDAKGKLKITIKINHY